MTKIDIQEKSKEVKITATGHTETRICAAVSFILQALVQVMLDYGIGVKYRLTEGDIEIDIPKKDMGSYSTECFYHLTFVRRSLLLLAKQNPDSLSVNFVK